MTAPDFPMTPPTRDAWQRRRKAAWPRGTWRGGWGGFERLLGAENEEEPLDELLGSDIDGEIL